MRPQDALEKFKKLELNMDNLKSILGEDLFNVKLVKPCVIDNNDLMFILKEFKENRIELSQLLDWVNTVWFTDLFDYKNKHAECISTIMPYLEEADEEGHELTVEAVDKYIACLSANKPLE